MEKAAADRNPTVPAHIGFIVDGNRRWAKQHGLPSYEGHLAGYNALKDVLIETLGSGVKYASAYVFSTENWKRSQDEVGRLMGLFVKMLSSDVKIFTQNNVRLRVIGSREGLDDKLIQAIEAAEAQTANLTGGDLLLCLNYGGQLEIADAVKQIVAAGVQPGDITPEVIAANIYAPDVPACDMIVRTGGDLRLSNFMLWRAAYSEFYSIEKHWPDMTKADVSVILKEYARRQRRFGG